MRYAFESMSLASAVVLACSAHHVISTSPSNGRVIAFAPRPSPSATHRRKTRHAPILYDILPRDGGAFQNNGGEEGGIGNGNNEEDASIQSARERLEALMVSSTTTSEKSGNKSKINDGAAEDEEKENSRYAFSLRPSPQSESSKIQSRLDPDVVAEELLHPPPLTTIGRARLDAEMECLSALIDSDQPLSDLWTLWFSERGQKACQELKAAEQLSMGGPQYWDEAEAKLRELIEEHGVHWAEPVNRLATLMYLRGKLKESKALCEIVLAVKPWHFGALSGVVMVCAGLSDVSGARMWADRRLPPLRPDGDTTERRILWVERAVKEALRAEQRAERRIWEDLDDEEDHQEEVAAAAASATAATTTKTSKSILMDEADDDAWQ